jgi:hypothetical protein
MLLADRIFFCYTVFMVIHVDLLYGLLSALHYAGTVLPLSLSEVWRHHALIAVLHTTAIEPG